MSAIEEYLNTLGLARIKIENIPPPQPTKTTPTPMQFDGIPITEAMIKASTVINWHNARQLNPTDATILRNTLQRDLIKIKNGSNATIKIWPEIDKAMERNVYKFALPKNEQQSSTPILYHLVQTSTNPVAIYIDYINKILSVAPHRCIETYSTVRPICKHVLAAIWNDITTAAIINMGTPGSNKTEQILGDWVKLTTMPTDDIRKAALYFYIKNLMPGQWERVNIAQIESIYGHQATI